MTSPMYWSTQHWLLCVSKLKYSSWMLFKHYISIDLISLFGSKPIPVLSNLHVARCGPWRHSVWPAKAHKNFRQWGPVQCPFFVSFRNAHTGWWRGCATTGDTHAVCSTALLCAASKMTVESIPTDFWMRYKCQRLSWALKTLQESPDNVWQHIRLSGWVLRYD